MFDDDDADDEDEEEMDPSADDEDAEPELELHPVQFQVVTSKGTGTQMVFSCITGDEGTYVHVRICTTNPNPNPRRPGLWLGG